MDSNAPAPDPKQTVAPPAETTPPVQAAPYAAPYDAPYEPATTGWGATHTGQMTQHRTATIAIAIAVGCVALLFAFAAGWGARGIATRFEMRRAGMMRQGIGRVGGWRQGSAGGFGYRGQMGRQGMMGRGWQRGQAGLSAPYGGGMPGRPYLTVPPSYETTIAP